MMCPKCLGRGWLAPPGDLGPATESHNPSSCDYPGCHGGSIDCCDGLQEQPNEERSDKGLEEKPSSLPD